VVTQRTPNEPASTLEAVHRNKLILTVAEVAETEGAKKNSFKVF